MYYKERTEFGTLSFSSDSTVGDDLLDELCRSAEIDRREPVRPAALHPHHLFQIHRLGFLLLPLLFLPPCQATIEYDARGRCF